jgi:hypothetical protein
MDALNGQVGSNFMLAIEPFSSSRPYMTSAGNHEVVMNFTQCVKAATLPTCANASKMSAM